MAHERPHRQPGDLEIGTADVFMNREGPPVHVVEHPPPPQWYLRYEKARPRLLVEMVAECFGTFLYCWGGMSNVGSLLSVAFAYCVAILLALICCASTSGGHFHPAFTIAFTIYKGFPLRKVPFYIVAQLLGAFVGSLIVIAQFHEPLTHITHEMEAAGKLREIFTPLGPASAIEATLMPGRNLGYVFFNEFMMNFVMGVVVFGILDPTNVFISPTNGPVAISLAFFLVIVAFSMQGAAINTARDLGSRMAAAVYWGHPSLVFPKKYTALSVLTNIVGVFFGAGFQILFLSDTKRAITTGAKQMLCATSHGQLAIDTSVPGITRVVSTAPLARTVSITPNSMEKQRHTGSHGSFSTRTEEA
ncbi:hypothetical protein Q8F55_007588 [Vanrija albida]|uniref:Aquaporin n=1 Tax=Vanrija albida TaxID=181172 RepID=A0ABR3PTZ2_9TREE